MLIEANNLIGLPIGAIEENQYLGKVRDILVERKNGTVMGLIVGHGVPFFENKLFLADMDILDIDKNGVTTRTQENLIDPQEILRAKKNIEEKFNLVNLPANTKNGKYLGKISNYVIDTVTMQIIKYYVHGLFEDKIISNNQVIKISKKEIIFENDLLIGNAKSNPNENYKNKLVID